MKLSLTKAVNEIFTDFQKDNSGRIVISTSKVIPNDLNSGKHETQKEKGEPYINH